MFTRDRAARFLSDADFSVRAVRARARLPRGRGIPLDRVRHLRIDDLDGWVVRQYGRGPFPVVVIGSASGGALHLAAALRAPFLPQTTLSPVRDLATRVDDPAGAMAALAPTTRLVAENNPRVSVYHVHDPVQHRRMLEGTAHLRLKRRRLGRPYERFLEERLAPGGTILQVECTGDWRVHAVGERAYFQFGRPGGLSEREYHAPGERVARFLEREHSPVRAWEPPEMEERRPEAEWGFEPELGKDVTVFAEQYGNPLRRLVSREPDDHSPFVADLLRWWYGRLGRPTDRLLVESYLRSDPVWAMRTGSVPFWLRSAMEPDLGRLRDYLEAADPYDTIHLGLFPYGVAAPGMVPLDRWEELLADHALRHGELIGVDRDTYPAGRGGAAGYRRAVESIPSRLPLPGRLDISDVDRFLAEAAPRYRLTWS